MKTLAIEQLLRAAAHQNDMISLAGSLPAQRTFPTQALANATTAAILEMQADLKYDWPEHRRPLREHIAARLRARGADVVAEEVIITNGAQDALALTIELLAPSAIQVDPETCPAALEVFTRHQCTPTTGHRLAVRYAMPSVQTPTGRTATAAERADILQSAVIIEDDAYADLMFDTKAPRPLIADGRRQVFHIGTFSKIISPALKVGWLVPPREWLRVAKEAKHARETQHSGLTQAVVEQFVSSPRFDERLEALRKHYRQRADALISHLPKVPNVRFTMPAGGFSLWLETDCDASDVTLLRAALKRGVAFDPSCVFRVMPNRDQPLAMRLSFSSVPEHQLATGVRRLAQALEDIRTEPHQHAAA